MNDRIVKESFEDELNRILAKEQEIDDATKKVRDMMSSYDYATATPNEEALLFRAASRDGAIGTLLGGGIGGLSGYGLSKVFGKSHSPVGATVGALLGAGIGAMTRKSASEDAENMIAKNIVINQMRREGRIV